MDYLPAASPLCLIKVEFRAPTAWAKSQVEWTEAINRAIHNRYHCDPERTGVQTFNLRPDIDRNPLFVYTRGTCCIVAERGKVNVDEFRRALERYFAERAGFALDQGAILDVTVGSVEGS